MALLNLPLEGVCIWWRVVKGVGEEGKGGASREFSQFSTG